FFLAALMGLALRYAVLHPLGINYRFLTHAHSHVAMLGWVYLMLYVLFVHYFVPEKKPVYNRLFWATQLAVLGMLFSFPFQGYAALSITFSTLHILCSYYFVYRIWKGMHIENRLTKRLVLASLLFMVLSTFGVWCLGPAVGLMGKASAFYQIAIQFFLHFQFNGWFVFAVLGLLVSQLNIPHSSASNRFFYLFTLATVLTFALPVSWFIGHPILYTINAIGIALQLVALYYLWYEGYTAFIPFLQKHLRLVKHLFLFAFSGLILKILLQILAVFPEFSAQAYQNRNFVIGFIHLLMLGFVSGSLFAFLAQNTLKPAAGIKLGLYLFILGFVTTESLLGIQGFLFYF